VVRRHAGDDVQFVVVVSEPAEGVSPPRRRRARPVPAGPEASPAPVTRVTVIEGEPVGDGAAWLRAADLSRVADEALAVLRRVVAAHRVAAADPCVADPDREQALVARVGYGSGEQVADGDWEAARTLPPPRRRGRNLAPQERLAALLAGRDVALACEELTLRARADVDGGRWREAALQLDAALAAALAELEGWREQRDLAARLDEVAGYVDRVRAAAAAARSGTLEPAQAETLKEALGRLEATLRARAVAAS
jgi:hypothetical protein